MQAATDMARRAGDPVPQFTCARSEGPEPRIGGTQPRPDDSQPRSDATDADFATTLARWAVEEAGQGTFAVIAPPERLVEIAMIIEDAVPGTQFGPEVDLRSPCVVITQIGRASCRESGEKAGSAE